MKERDTMYGGYYNSVPGYNSYANYGYQGPPGSLIMPSPYQNNSYLENNPFNEINNRLNELEVRLNKIENKLNKYNNFKEDDESIYML